jgi:competence protein ComEC
MVFSKLFFFSLISFIFGIFLSSYFIEIGKIIPVFFILFFFLSMFLLFSKKSIDSVVKIKFISIGIFLIIFTFGFSWNLYHLNKRNESNFAIYNNKKDVSLEGTIVKEPENKEKTMHLVLKPSKINGYSLNKDKEKILVIVDKYLEINYLDEVSLIGRIDIPRNFDNFDYVGYLAKQKIYSLIFYPEIQINPNQSKRFSFHNMIVKFRQKSNKFIVKNLPMPHSSILSAIILGNKEKISSSWQEKFSVSGINHVIAISGMHVMILIFFLNIFFRKMKSRKFKLFLIIFIISLFVLMTGLSSSAIRAGIMGTIILFSQSIGRPVNSFRLLVFTAFLMLSLNPLILKNDIGFQFSFLAIVGIIFLFDFFSDIFKFIPKNLREIIALSFSANVFIYPLLGHYFGSVSIIFPIVNLLIVPTISLIMIFGLVFILTSFLLNYFSYIFLIPLWISLEYLTSVVSFFSRFPWASLIFNDIKIFLIIFYICLFIVFLNYKKKNKDFIFT